MSKHLRELRKMVAAVHPDFELITTKKHFRVVLHHRGQHRSLPAPKSPACYRWQGNFQALLRQKSTELTGQPVSKI